MPPLPPLLKTCKEKTYHHHFLESGVCRFYADDCSGVPLLKGFPQRLQALPPAHDAAAMRSHYQQNYFYGAKRLNRSNTKRPILEYAIPPPRALHACHEKSGWRCDNLDGVGVSWGVFSRL